MGDRTTNLVNSSDSERRRLSRDSLVYSYYSRNRPNEHIDERIEHHLIRNLLKVSKSHRTRSHSCMLVLALEASSFVLPAESRLLARHQHKVMIF